jgi:hypothetical protein
MVRAILDNNLYRRHPRPTKEEAIAIGTIGVGPTQLPGLTAEILETMAFFGLRLVFLPVKWWSEAETAPKSLEPDGPAKVHQPAW